MGHKNKKKNKSKKTSSNDSIDESIKETHIKPEKNNDELQTEETLDDSGSNVQKRYHAEDDSDVEEQPKRKKKKKQAISTEPSDKKGKKSIRQMKREKHAQRQAEASAAAKDELKSQCLSYLSQWKHNRQDWKFMKAKQIWLFKNKFSSHLVPDSTWPTLLEYFESAQGNIRSMLLEDSNKVIKQMDDWTESQNKEKTNEDTEDQSETKEVTQPDVTSYKRARDLIQCLQE